jgi:inner membrane protein
MPSPLTHAVVGAATARTLPDNLPRWRLAIVLAVVGTLPDVDLIAFFVGIPYDHTLGHRGLTHALPVAAAAGLLAVPIAHRLFHLDRVDARRVGLAAALSLALHGLLDTVTDGGLGVGLLMPFVDARIVAPIRPVAVSPLRWNAFLADAVRILASEIVWIWLPTLLACTIPVRKRPDPPLLGRPAETSAARSPSSIERQSRPPIPISNPPKSLHHDARDASPSPKRCPFT